ncbi:hypothetical protein ACWFRT_13935 [Streptomyces anulatus]
MTADPKQPAYDAVFAYISSQPDALPATVVERNAMIWRAVHAALGANPPEPADRAATLRAAADHFDSSAEGRFVTQYFGHQVAAELRTLAAEAAARVQPPTTTEADTVLAAAIPEWEAVYEPGNVSDYLIGYANTEAAAKGAAIAWVLSQSDKAADRLDWDPQNWNDRHDAWFDLVERHDDGVDTGVGVTVRHRLHPYTAADFAPEDDEQPAAPAAPEEPQ